ncbi:MAG: 4-hydroxy-tetrahydrodipicolinate reductase [Eubacteriales bacterium]|jgi:4-hydroxy-tetrahydrodipicolinate reductase|nr:4-hydroxy-tetrahydrodipicolinate reductase [Eubacteriales bacterium]
MPVNILLAGANGRMGHIVTAVAEEIGFRIAAGIDINESDKIWGGFPIFTHTADLPAKPSARLGINVIVDFSHHTALESLLKFAVGEQLPLVVATTGHTEAEIAAMHAASASVPIFYSRNMSLGINLVTELCRKAAAALEGFDIEIIEKHHNKKLDAPSGTALMIADAVSETLSQRYKTQYTYHRDMVRRERMPNEIGIHSVRGGTIIGEHEVIFAGDNEVVTISHSAESRDVFARGALRAAAFITDKPAGIYNMNSIIDAMEL